MDCALVLVEGANQAQHFPVALRERLLCGLPLIQRALPGLALRSKPCCLRVSIGVVGAASLRLSQPVCQCSNDNLLQSH